VGGDVTGLGLGPWTIDRDPGDVAASPGAAQLRVPADAHEIAGLRTAVLAFAEELGMAEVARADVALAVSEACTNVVMHAYIDDPAPGWMILEASHHRGELVVAVRDEGRGMLPRHDSPGLGLGLPLIGRLARRVEIRQNGARGTEVLLTFPTAES
jgi:anti-sigma regulatory factor (Ser/Thr protein kinase)